MLPTLALTALCWFLGLHFVLTGVLAANVLQGQEIWLILDALLKPAAVFFGATVLLLTHLLGAPGRVRSAAVLVVAAVLLLVVPGIPPDKVLPAFLPFLLVFLAAWPLLLWLRSRPRTQAALLALLGLLATLGVGLWNVPVEPSAPNRLGLVAFVPNSIWSRDFSQDANKDHYPFCTFVQNSLGYRDIEPNWAQSGRTRVLLVGDSYIWGDGIATEANTLGTLLRARLEALAPGRFDVVSAGYPGNGIYGYTRAVEQLAPVLHPNVAVIGYLGEADLNPVDAQSLTEGQLHGAWLRTLMLRMHTGQHLHEWSVGIATELGQTPESKLQFQQLFQRLAACGRANGTQVALLNYPSRAIAPQGAFAVPKEIQRVDLPEPLRYRGQASELWYAKDSHPKPLLNQKLADLLAQWLLQRPQR